MKRFHLKTLRTTENISRKPSLVRDIALEIQAGMCSLLRFKQYILKKKNNNFIPALGKS